MSLLEKILPQNNIIARKAVSIGITVLLADILTVIGIYGIEVYGMAIFIFTPLFIGACPVILFGDDREVTRKTATNLGLLSILFFSFTLLLFAIEGAVCIAMSLPFGAVLTWIGTLIGRSMATKKLNKGTATLLILVAAIPLTGFMEKDIEADTFSVSTSISIDATPQEVWKNIVGFPPLKEPEEFMFKAGISYPTDATIEGSGVGAVRHCNFNTGSFTEPITVWNEPNLLCFSVTGQPAPMKELSFWDIDAPHLHDFFVSEKGQFKLTELPGNKTLLEGTTWYHHDIKPQFYWKLWSDLIIHKIHVRVLSHIKANSEKTKR